MRGFDSRPRYQSGVIQSAGCVTVNHVIQVRPLSPEPRGCSSVGQSTGLSTRRSPVQARSVPPCPCSSVGRAPARRAGGHRIIPCRGHHAPVVQRKGHLTTNQAGAGSSPAGGAHGLLAQPGERRVHTAEAAGSTPARSTGALTQVAEGLGCEPRFSGSESRKAPQASVAESGRLRLTVDQVLRARWFESIPAYTCPRGAAG